MLACGVVVDDDEEGDDDEDEGDEDANVTVGLDEYVEEELLAVVD